MDVEAAGSEGADEKATENVFSEDFSADFENGWNNENANNQPPISQQPDNRFTAAANNNNNRNQSNNRGKTGRGRGGAVHANNWNPHSQMQQPPPMQQQATQELWVETKTGDGKSYFYHAVTRETTWTRPEGPNIKIMTQPEFEAYTRQQMSANKPLEQAADPNIKPNIAMIPNLMDQPPPFVPPFNANISPFGLHAPPHFNAPWQNPQWQQQHPASDPAKMFDSKIDPKVVAKAAEWSEHRAPDGRPYYFNAARGESVWERPQALKDLDMARSVFMQQHPPTVAPPTMTMTQGSITFDSAGNMVKPGAPMTNKQPAPDMEMAEKERKRKEELEKAKQQPAKPQDKSRPVSSTAIAGTPWCVVWTGDSRVFFYNPSTRTSVWQRPEDLIGRADVDKLVSTIPDQLKGTVSEKEEQVSESPGSTGKKTEPEKAVEEEESEEDEELPAKKSKIEEQATAAPVKIQNAPAIPEKKVDVVKDPAAEAEQKAAKERAMVPLETRVKQFKEMLKEKEVSAFSTWEKELHKIVFDPRYLLLASKERKQVFEKYVKDRAEDERREKRHKMQKKRDDFKKLMEDANLHSRSSFSDFCSRYSRDERYKGIDKMRERENIFNDHLGELRRKEKDEKHQKKEQVRKDFFELLKEHSDIDRHSHWMDIKKSLEQDSRYKAVNDSVLREDYFYEYIKLLKEERKKEKAKKAKKSEKKEKKKKSKDKDRSRNESSRNSDEPIKIDDDDDDDNSCEKKEEKERATEKNEDDNKSEMEVDKSGSDSDKDQEDGEHSGTDEDSETEKARKERERQMRAAASIKEREKQVQRELAEHMRDRDKERQHHKRDEAIRNFSALLADLVRNSDLAWKEVKKQLKKDHRWDAVEELEREERERLFNEHINLLTKKKRDKFREMLDEIANLELTTSWKDIKKSIRDDPRYVKFGHSDKCEREFREYLRDKCTNARTAFKELLQECKLITHKSFDTFKENSNHLKEIEDILKNDKRYLVLEHMSRERTEMILDYFEEMKKKGAPAPITSVESNRRKK